MVKPESKNDALIGAFLNRRLTKDIIQYLIAKGADINYPKKTGLSLYPNATPFLVFLKKHSNKINFVNILKYLV